MASNTIIRVGDRTSHGGTVLEGHPFVLVLGKPVAGVGHRVSCPRCAGDPVIAQGSMFVTMMGIEVAVEGMKTSCGATLIGSAVAQTAIG
nr:PAAR domain-containing protein [uncultured Massilia sp.]